jgi:broad specificity phosphatase PhoE
VLILVRHGRTAANAAGLLLGRADVPLDEVGRGQAATLRPALAGATRVVSSPLQRAVSTASALGVPVEVDERWIEVDYGEYDEMPVGAVPPDAWDSFRDDPDFALPGGESLAEVAKRVQDGCAALSAAAAAGDVVVVSHVSPIKVAVALALEVGVEVAWRMRLDVAAITRLEPGARGFTLHSYNQTSHLPPQLRTA